MGAGFDITWVIVNASKLTIGTPVYHSQLAICAVCSNSNERILHFPPTLPLSV